MESIFLWVIFGLVFLAIIIFCYNTIGAFILGVPFVRSRTNVAKRMVEVAKLKKGQKVYDLGCGDGRILLFAAKKGAKCTGIERLRSLIWLGKLRNKIHKKKAEFRCENFFHTDLSDADVIFCYLFPKLMERFFQEKWPELKKGTKVISNAFPMKKCKEKEKIREGQSWIYVYIK